MDDDREVSIPSESIFVIEREKKPDECKLTPAEILELDELCRKGETKTI